MYFSGSERDIAVAQSVSSDYQLTKACFDFLLLPTTTGLSVILPAANDLTLRGASKLGGPHFFVFNAHASTNMSLKNKGGTPLITLNAQFGALIGLIDNSTTNGTWWIRQLARKT